VVKWGKVNRKEKGKRIQMPEDDYWRTVNVREGFCHEITHPGDDSAFDDNTDHGTRSIFLVYIQHW
jgi:hypothetical protein